MDVYMYANTYVCMCMCIIFDYTVMLENLEIMESHNTHNPAIPKYPDTRY